MESTPTVQTVEREKEWLLKREVPFACDEIKNILEVCFDPKKKGSGQLITFKSSDGVVKGNLRLEGWNVSGAEVCVQATKWNKNAPFKTQINSGTPIKLSQIHNVYNHFKVCLSHLEEIEAQAAAVDVPVSIMMNNINKLVQQATDCIKLARDEILLPNRNLFPQSTLSSIHSTQPMLFQPSLPQDLVIEMSVSNRQLLLSVFFLHVIPTQPTSPPPTPSKTNSYVGRTYKCTNQGTKFWAEVLDHVQISCQADILDLVFAQINSAYEFCVDLRDKITLFL